MAGKIVAGDERKGSSIDIVLGKIYIGFFSTEGITKDMVEKVELVSGGEYKVTIGGYGQEVLFDFHLKNGKKYLVKSDQKTYEAFKIFTY